MKIKFLVMRCLIKKKKKFLLAVLATRVHQIYCTPLIGSSYRCRIVIANKLLHKHSEASLVSGALINKPEIDVRAAKQVEKAYNKYATP